MLCTNPSCGLLTLRDPDSYSDPDFSPIPVVVSYGIVTLHGNGNGTGIGAENGTGTIGNNRS